MSGVVVYYTAADNNSTVAIPAIPDISGGVLLSSIVAVTMIIASVIFRQRIKTIAVRVDDYLFEFAKDRGRIIRNGVFFIRLLLPSNQLRGYIDYQIATALENDDVVDLSTVSTAHATADPVKYWRLGFTLESIMCGLSMDRENPEGNSVVDELIESLKQDKSQIVTGPPGSGKSTVCKQVACVWYQRSIGPVLYRESGHGAIEHKAALKETIQRMPPDQALLIVAEDICHPEHASLVEALTETNRENIRYLFDSRVSDIENLTRDQSFTTVRSKQAASTIASELGRYPIPNMSMSECEKVVQKYEQVTGSRVVGSAETLYQRIEGKTEIGQMLMLAYELSSESVELSSGGLSSLELDVDNKYGVISEPAKHESRPELKQHEPDLLYDVSFVIMLYNILDIPIYRDLLILLRDKETDRSEIRRILSSLEGFLIFESETEKIYETYHNLWSVYYLRRVVNDQRREIREVYVDSLNTLLDLLQVSEDKTESEISDSNFVYQLVLYIYAMAGKWPAISDLFVDININDLSVPEVLRPELDADLMIERSAMYLNAGNYQLAEKELNDYYEVLSNLAEVDPQELETFYAHSLARIYVESGRHRKARECTAEALADITENDLSRAYLLNLFGTASTQLGEFDQGVDALSEAVEIARRSRDRRLEYNCVLNIGIALERGNNYDPAEEYYREAVEMAEEIGDSLYISRSNHNLGQLIFTISAIRENYSRMPEAVERLQHSLRIKSDAGDSVGQAKTLGSLSSIYTELEEYDTAKEYAQKSISIAEQHSNIDLLATCYHNYALILRDQGERSESKKHLRLSIELHDQSGNEIERFRSLNVLTYMYLTEGKLVEAAECAISGLDLCMSVGDHRTAVEVIRFLIDLCIIITDDIRKMGIFAVVIENMIYLDLVNRSTL